jgi:hypothetical protein
MRKRTPPGANSSPQPAQATHHVAQAQRRRQRFDLIIHSPLLSFLRREPCKNETFWHDSDPWRIFSTSSWGLWAFPRALTYIYGIPTHHLWSNQHVQRSPVLSPRCDAGSGSGRHICTQGRLPGFERSTWGSAIAG